MNNTDNCPHCGAEEIISFPYDGISRLGEQEWKCKTPFVRCADGEISEVDFRTDLCRERQLRKKAEKEVEHYKQFISETVEACEPLRNIKGLELGQRISVEGVKLMIEENQKLRELLDGSLVALARAVKYLATEPKSSYEDALWRIQQQLSQITK